MKSVATYFALLAMIATGLLTTSRSSAQYLYLDANANGVHDTGDRLNPIGTPTAVDLYVRTNQNRDGSTVACDTGAEPLTINQYQINLLAVGGSVTYTEFVNHQVSMPTSFGEFNPDGIRYKNGFGGGTQLAAGSYRLCTLTITSVSGSPGIDLVDLVSGSADFTGFGTSCFGRGFDNVYRLDGPNVPPGTGEVGDFTDWDGLSSAESLNNPPQFSAPASAQVKEGTQVSISATAQDPDAGQKVSISVIGQPPFLALTGGERGPIPASATVVGTPGYADAGTYQVKWIAADDGAPAASTSFTTVLTVQNSDRPPVVSAPASVAGSASDPISFFVVVTDPDGDAVQALSATKLPAGSSFTTALQGTQGTFTWVPEPGLTGTYFVCFTATGSGGDGQATTSVQVGQPAGPRKPHVDDELRDLKPGLASSERILSRGEDGKVYVDLFLFGDASTQSLRDMGVAVGTRFGRSMTARCPLEALPALFNTTNLDAVVAPASCSVLLDSSMVDIEVSGIRTLPDAGRPLVGRAGAGVIIGIVDTGIDVDHTDFLRISGSTRLISYWNQTRTTALLQPPNFNYGTQWLPTHIDGGQVDVWSADSVGHGTHVAGIAAGNADAASAPCFVGSGLYAYLGVAPEADLCVVKTVASTDFKKVSALETRIIDGINYIFQRAQAQSPAKPAVVNVSLGSQWGPHNGRSRLDWFINNLTGPGKIVVAAAGNDANTGAHGLVQLHPGGPQEITFEVGDYTPVPNASGEYIRVLGWYNEMDTLSVTVVTPNGTVVGPIPLGDGTVSSTPDGTVNICHGEVCVSSAHLLPMTWSPDIPFALVLSDVFQNEIASGVWTIRISSSHIGSTAGNVDVYKTEADLGPDTPLIQFVQGADPTRTITSPASADSVIAVGGYSTRNCWKRTDGQVVCQSFADALGDILHFSSLGPRRDGVTKPDITAPGAMVVASRSSTSFIGNITQVVLGGKYVAQAGTSMSAPHVAGAVALMLGRTDTNPDSIGHLSTPSQIKARLLASARADLFTGNVPNNTWGAGKLDVRAALAPVMGLRFTEPRKGTVVSTHWGQASVMADSSTPGNALDSVVVMLALDGCHYTERVAKLTNIGLVKKSYSFLYFAPEAYRTSEAKLLATGYVGPNLALGPNQVQAISDSVFSFEFGSPPTGVDAPEISRRFALHRNAPNPFNPVTRIQFEVAKAGPVTLRIFSVDGHLVRTLIEQPLPPGPYSVLWDGGNDRAEPVAAGVYFYEATSAGERQTRKMTLIK